MHEILDVSARAGKWRRGDRGDIQAEVDSTARNSFDSFHMVLRIAHHSPVAESFFSDLELRLHHQQEVSFGRRRGDERRKYQRQRNERHIADHKLGSRSDGSGVESTHVRPVVYLDTRVALQLPRELAIPDVDGDNGRCAPP